MEGSSKSVNYSPRNLHSDGEQEGELFGLRKRTNQVHMNLREPLSRNQYMMNWRLHMTETLDLTLFAVETRLSPEVYILCPGNSLWEALLPE